MDPRNTRAFTHADTFDLEAWLASVDGETATITAPGPDELGPLASRLINSPSQYDVPYCEECEAHVRLVHDGDGAIGDCPICGTEPGMLELGTRADPEEVSS